MLFILQGTDLLDEWYHINFKFKCFIHLFPFQLFYQFPLSLQMGKCINWGNKVCFESCRREEKLEIDLRKLDLYNLYYIHCVVILDISHHQYRPYLVPLLHCSDTQSPFSWIKVMDSTLTMELHYQSLMFFDSTQTVNGWVVMSKRASEPQWSNYDLAWFFIHMTRLKIGNRQFIHPLVLFNGCFWSWSWRVINDKPESRDTIFLSLMRENSFQHIFSPFSFYGPKNSTLKAVCAVSFCDTDKFLLIF